MQRRHFISAASSKEKRLVRRKKILEEIRSAGDMILIWSDEKIFTVEARANFQNDRILSQNSTDIPVDDRTVFRHQKPAGVMVRAAVASDCSRFPLIFIEEGVKLNSQVCVKILEEVFLWIPEAFGNDYDYSYIFTQDSAPAQTSNFTQRWCTGHFSDFLDKRLWPPSSLDMNLIDFVI